MAVIATMLLSASACNTKLHFEVDRYNSLLKEMRCAEQLAPNGIVMFESGRLNGGYGIVARSGDSPDVLVFWMKNDAFYTVNEAAQACAPHLGKAPETVTQAGVLEVAR